MSFADDERAAERRNKVGAALVARMQRDELRRQRARQKRIDLINSFAQREGWLIVDGSEIQADDSDDIGRGFKLANDRTARLTVERLADVGSALHREALELVKP